MCSSIIYSTARLIASGGVWQVYTGAVYTEWRILNSAAVFYDHPRRSFMISIPFCYRNLPNSTGLCYASYSRNNRRLFERGVWPPRSPDLTSPGVEERVRSSERNRSKIPQSIWGLRFSQRGCWKQRSTGILHHINWQVVVFQVFTIYQSSSNAITELSGELPVVL
jgi:hypothetical protein